MQNRNRFQSYRMSVEEALQAVTHARKLGYALRDRGLVPGTRALSVTINTDGEAVAALTIAAIGRRLPNARVASVAGELRKHAVQLEAILAPSAQTGFAADR
jgi:DNA-binding IclR family transcriptional regulator